MLAFTLGLCLRPVLSGLVLALFCSLLPGFQSHTKFFSHPFLLLLGSLLLFSLLDHPLPFSETAPKTPCPVISELGAESHCSILPGILLKEMCNQGGGWADKGNKSPPQEMGWDAGVGWRAEGNSQDWRIDTGCLAEAWC